MAMLKSLWFIPLCVLILSGYVFADDYANHSSNSDVAKSTTVKNSSGVSGVSISAYAQVITEVIKYHMADSLDIYKGKSCILKIGLSRDGTVLYVVDDGGDSGLCNTAVLAVHSIKKFPPPTSDSLYQVFKDATLNFRL
ncbi:hypothetical protein GF271_00035 [Salmonella enterica subsp. enterica serovar Newport]|nr:hypothetical protein [Salmonella enterica subsp. enterica serovar Newport]